MKLRLLSSLCVLMLPMTTPAAEHGFLNKTFKNSDGTESKYVLFIPHNYTGEKAYPTILFLHGAGESGSDGLKQSTVGIGPAIKKNEKTFPFIVIMPQASHLKTPVRQRWYAESPDGKRALAILDEVSKSFKVDDKQVYLSGLSMGGYGTWNIAAKHPDKWAAIVPICGGGDSKDAAALKDLPCWCFHGDQDKAVPVKLSQEMIAAVKAAGGEPKYTEYAGVDHNSWDKAYGTAELYTWLLAQKRK